MTEDARRAQPPARAQSRQDVEAAVPLQAVSSRRYWPRRFDKYLLVQTAGPLSGGLAVILMALLLERVLRLLELLSNRGAGLDLLLQMAMNLVPHYLGLALPAAFFFSLFVVVTRLDTNGELDAMHSAGVSLSAIARPLVALGFIFSIFSIVLFGFLQPYSRYAFRAILHEVTSGEWNGLVTEGVFTNIGGGFTLSADAVDSGGRKLSGIFIRRIDKDGEMVAVARQGSLRFNKERTYLELVLEDGMQLRIVDNEVREKVAFSQATFGQEFRPDALPFRRRGGNDRELTLVELWSQSHDPALPALDRAHYMAEFHQRWVRAVALPFLPLLAIAMGTAAKRTHRGVGILVAGIVLVMFHHLVQLGQSLADVGTISPAAAVWTPLALFALFSVWTFYRTSSSPQGNPFQGLFENLEYMIASSSARLRFWRRQHS